MKELITKFEKTLAPYSLDNLVYNNAEPELKGRLILNNKPIANFYVNNRHDLEIKTEFYNKTMESVVIEIIRVSGLPNEMDNLGDLFYESDYIEDDLIPMYLMEALLNRRPY